MKLFIQSMSVDLVSRSSPKLIGLSRSSSRQGIAFTSPLRSFNVLDFSSGRIYPRAKKQHNISTDYISCSGEFRESVSEEEFPEVWKQIVIAVIALGIFQPLILPPAALEAATNLVANGDPPSLALVEELWEEYEKSKGVSDRVESANDDDEDTEDTDAPATRSQKDKLKLPRISRLQGLSPSGSSTASTPSSLSSTSSRSTLTNASSVSSPSSHTSAFVSQLGSKPSPTAGQTFPLFVTWNTLSRHGHKSLRGCIGTFDGQELEEGLKSYALTSAFEDTRFYPIPASLVPSLSCSLTLLSTFEPCSDALDWDLGTHGLRISFIHRNRRYGATYLPDVAVEQGWTKEETLESLMRKAGWDGSSGGMARKLLRGGGSSSGATHSGKPWETVTDFKVVRYQGLKSSANYAEWQEWRTWVASLHEKSQGDIFDFGK
ncbi:hypothetical protein FQN54_009363 [Arachnomyces sp. PD_36]|nr:hypothetical protein FQN54_009363 [Arachnomyces sp. PD_36]